MKFFGLHWVDAGILLGYIVAVLAIGRIFSHGVKGQGDFFSAAVRSASGCNSS
jgi:hypothetical protein